MWRRNEMEISSVVIWSKSDLEIMINTSIRSVNRRKLTVERTWRIYAQQILWCIRFIHSLGWKTIAVNLAYCDLYVCVCVVEREFLDLDAFRFQLWNHVTLFRLNWFQQNINMMIDWRNSCTHTYTHTHSIGIAFYAHVLLFVYAVWVFSFRFVCTARNISTDPMWLFIGFATFHETVCWCFFYQLA